MVYVGGSLEEAFLGLLEELEARMFLMDRGSSSVFRVKLAKSGVVVEFRSLGLIGRYVLLELRLGSISLSIPELSYVLRSVADGLEGLGKAVYVDLVASDCFESFIRGFIAGLSGADVVLVHYVSGRRLVDPLLVVVNGDDMGRVGRFIEQVTSLLDKVLEPLVNVRKVLRESLSRVRDKVRTIQGGG